MPHDRATIERIGEAAGWRTRFFSRAAPGLPPVFHVVEVWVENRLLLEVVPADLIEVYETYMQIGRMDALDLSLNRTVARRQDLRGRTMSVENAAEVLIVGAGPTGLSLAITLRRRGIRCASSIVRLSPARFPRRWRCGAPAWKRCRAWAWSTSSWPRVSA